MGETKRNGGRQKGAQVHDEHLRGDKTVSKIAENWNNPPVNENRDATTGPTANSRSATYGDRRKS